MHDEHCFRCNALAFDLHDVATEGARVLVPLCSACRVAPGQLQIALEVTFSDGTVMAHGPSAASRITPIAPRTNPPRRPSLPN